MQKLGFASITAQSESKWTADTSVPQAESMLKLKDRLETRAWLGKDLAPSLPAMVQGRPKAQERNDPSRGPTPGGGVKSKGGGARITRGLDKVEPATTKDPMERTLVTDRE